MLDFHLKVRKQSDLLPVFHLFPLQASLTCAVCGAGQHSRHSVLKHLRDQHHHQETNKTLMETKVHIRCGICPAQYEANPTEFLQHTNHHGAELLEEQTEFQCCDICDFKHVSENTLKKHLASVHNLKPYKCSKCDFDSKSLNGLFEHLKNDHPDLRLQCEKCQLSYTSVPALKRHIKDRHERTLCFVCTFCEKKFKRKENVRDHSLRLHGSAGEH